MQQAAQAIVEQKPDAIVIFGPHGPLFGDSFTLEAEPVLRGSFAAFGAPEEQLTVACDLDLTAAIIKECVARQLPLAGLTARLKERFRLSAQLDHGVLIPLWFLRAASQSALPPLVIINMAGLPLLEHYALGKAIQQAVQVSGKRVAIIGSGDLSHCLSDKAPGGYHQEAHRFDEAVAELLRSQQVQGLPTLEELAGVAGECGLRPLAVFLGCFDGLAGEHQVLSYEAPWGVGYLVATRQVVAGAGPSYLDKFLAERQEAIEEQRAGESQPVQLARLVVESYVRTGRIPKQLPKLPTELPPRAGAFVTIHKYGQLRGCIGTTEATRPTLAEEIARNAVSAASDDPRFEPIGKEELPHLVYSVDVLGEAELITSEQQLDPRVYGVIVERGMRRGLLLPDLPGIDTAEAQVTLAKRKAGISPRQTVTLYRFRVTRYH
jgi:AmmeMemoRadiSam system protein A